MKRDYGQSSAWVPCPFCAHEAVAKPHDENLLILTGILELVYDIPWFNMVFINLCQR